MTRSERRIAIAKDVIEQINLGKMCIRSSNGYLAGKLPKSCINRDSETKISPLMARDIQKSCKMCIRGALMISKIAQFNEVTMENLNFDLDYISIHVESTADILEGAFSGEELDIIEQTFEGWADKKIGIFYCDHNDDADRVIAICQNIVDHGFFDPSVRYDVV